MRDSRPRSSRSEGGKNLGWANLIGDKSGLPDTSEGSYGVAKGDSSDESRMVYFLGVVRYSRFRVSFPFRKLGGFNGLRRLIDWVNASAEGFSRYEIGLSCWDTALTVRYDVGGRRIWFS